MYLHDTQWSLGANQVHGKAVWYGCRQLLPLLFVSCDVGDCRLLGQQRKHSRWC